MANITCYALCLHSAKADVKLWQLFIHVQEYCVNHGTAIKILQTLRDERPELAAHLQVQYFSPITTSKTDIGIETPRRSYCARARPVELPINPKWVIALNRSQRFLIVITPPSATDNTLSSPHPSSKHPYSPMKTSFTIVTLHPPSKFRF